ncbi:mannose-1-phosphate guanylyltransferase/mannose-6-phosphate isomerase [Arcobacter sp. 15-2]|uniref:mannose-1-phosphate guanylyltransferase/mannose-6-phosphate isomerase n=1 Tax=Arcobacter sp. 15-2 TaxID=3374109 RepID=UPI00399C91E7
MTNIILCGGNGTRLWPISRTLMPKQFVKLFDDKSLFQLTVERNSKVCDSQFIVSNAEQYFLSVDQLEELNEINNKYLLEPVGRNTAPAITLACLSLDPQELVLVTPSDHLIKNESEYEKVLNQAKELATEDNLVTFGITPTCPETGFGYIELQGEYVAKAFHEKPNLSTAQSYLDAGNYYWNSGMFLFKSGVFLEELQKYSPAIYEASLEAFKNADQDTLIRIKHDDMENIPEDSIDYAVMEKSNKVKVIPSDIDWSDVGSFDALSEELQNDNNNNLIISNKKVATIDVEDLIIVDTDDALLISKKGSTQKVKDIVSDLKIQNSKLTTEHSTVHRPWGTYTVLEDTPGYKIKRIEVKAGKRLSLQKHFHRSEHWIVVSGTATVTVGESTKLVRPNESTYIKMGEIHRLENQGKISVVLIEAQVGEYTGEDDIVRLDDDYQRKEQ